MNTIYQMNHAISAAADIREAEQDAYKASRKARHDQCADVCQAIVDIMQEDYLAWVEAQPVKNFFDTARDKLLSLQPAIGQDGTEASPYIVGGEIFLPAFVSAHDVDMPF